MSVTEEKPSSDSSPARASELPLPEKKKHSFFARMFSKEHKFGRFMRALARGIAIVVILLGLGALAVWYFLMRPLYQQYQALQASATQTALDLQTSQAELQKANQRTTTAHGEAINAQSTLENEQAMVQVLRIMLHLSDAQVSALNKDLPGAKEALSAAEETFNNIQPQIEKIDANQAKTLQALFTLATNDLERDEQLFIQDIIRLNNEMKLVEKSLTPSGIE